MARWTRSLRYFRRYPQRVREMFKCLGTCDEPVRFIRRYVTGRGGYPFHLGLKNGIHLDLNDFGDLVTAWVVFLREEYKIPSEAGTLLDLGANIGCFSLHAAAKYRSARIVAVEPHPATFARLADNIRTNRFEDRIEAWSVGLAAQSGHGRMGGDGPSQSRGVLPVECEAGSSEFVVDVLSLDELVGRTCEHFQSDVIDFVKMDIEGAEHEALFAASSDTSPTNSEAGDGVPCQSSQALAVRPSHGQWIPARKRPSLPGGSRRSAFQSIERRGSTALGLARFR